MKKNNVHDYAVSAFKLYAKDGKIPSGELFEKLKQSRREYLRYVSSGKCLKIKARKMSAETQKIRSVYLDAVAIERALLKPKNERDRLILKCVERVYFAIGAYGDRKGRTQALVTSCSMDLNISDSLVYQYLAEAVRRFCMERGLRMEEA